MKEIYTIGYAGYRSPEEMIDVLKKYNVTCLIDIRSVPYSTYHADFNKDALIKTLKKENIVYRHYAREFGARQKEFMTESKYVDFEAFAKSEQFIDGINKVTRAIELGYVVVLMCAEKDPKDCHRSILIGKEMKNYDFHVKHIIYPDQIETQEQMEERCIERQISMFDLSDPRETFYREQALKIAYRME